MVRKSHLLCQLSQTRSLKLMLHIRQLLDTPLGPRHIRARWQINVTERDTYKTLYTSMNLNYKATKLHPAFTMQILNIHSESSSITWLPAHNAEQKVFIQKAWLVGDPHHWISSLQGPLQSKVGDFFFLHHRIIIPGASTADTEQAGHTEIPALAYF